MNSWEHLFQEKILDRGYFITDDVKILNRNPTEVNAIVSGTFDYDVKITFDDIGNIDFMSCTCPYFEKDNCKHLAALLYFLEEDEENLEIEEEDISELFNNIDDKELKEFFLDELNSNCELKNKFKLKFDSKVDENYYKSKLDDIIYEEDFSYELSGFMDGDVEFLFDKREYNLILELMDDAFYSICRELENPWNDNYYDNLEEVSEVISRLVNTTASYDVFEWLTSVVSSRFDEDYINLFFEILFDNFKLKYQLEEKYELVSKIIPKMNSYYGESYVLFKVQLMQDLNYPQDEIDKFRLKYINYPRIRQQFIDESVNDNNYSKAIKLLERGISNSEYANDRHDFHVQLKDMYLKSNDMDSYKNELFKLIIEYGYIEDYKELKKQYNKTEWNDIREDIFLKCENNHFLNECYALEKLYDRLIDNIHYEYDLSRYKKILSRNRPKQLLEKYCLIVNQKASKTGSRKHYRNIAELLNEMLSIPDGEKVVLEILAEWKVKYKNRPAMWDELHVT